VLKNVTELGISSIDIPWCCRSIHSPCFWRPQWLPCGIERPRCWCRTRMELQWTSGVSVACLWRC